MNEIKQFDIAVIGAGFSGSLTALGLHQQGYNVILIEKGSHPRFAIGESSTPIADLILRDLADSYDLPWLRNMSRYGSWQRTFPEVNCGLKRGFSYFRHEPGRPFQTDATHINELLVAASPDDRHSDTNWFRSDVDAHFIERVKEKDITYWDNTEISDLIRRENYWEIDSKNSSANTQFHANWLIDATGSDNILGMLGVDGDSKSYHTSTSAIFSHFSGVKLWQNELTNLGIPDRDYPYNPDNSALHHILKGGWLWMLRFDHGITSCGLVLNNHRNQWSNLDKGEIWTRTLENYPSLHKLFENAALAEPPGTLIHMPRLQRGAEQAAGDQWVALPHTAGFIDPLHSTGIAHSLSGVERILSAFTNYRHKPAAINKALQRYGQSVIKELEFIDLLVDGCYRSMDHFELFHTYTMLYFTAAINYEQQRIKGNFKSEGKLFLSAGHERIRAISRRGYKKLRTLLRGNTVSQREITSFKEEVDKAIRPFNRAGLLNPEIAHMYHHTIADI